MQDIIQRYALKYPEDSDVDLWTRILAEYFRRFVEPRLETSKVSASETAFAEAWQAWYVWTQEITKRLGIEPSDTTLTDILPSQLNTGLWLWRDILTARMERVAFRLWEMRDPTYLDKARSLISLRETLAPMNPVIIGSIPKQP